MKSRLSILIFAVAAFALATPAFAQSAAGAVHGVIVAVSTGGAAPQQEQYGYQQYSYQQQGASYTRAIAGGAIGGLIGALAGRHSSSARWATTAAGTAIGAAIGRQADQRADLRTIQQERMAQQMGQRGLQVVVKLDSGQTVAVFTHQPQFYPGQQVWLVGNSQLIAAN